MSSKGREGKDNNTIKTLLDHQKNPRFPKTLQQAIQKKEKILENRQLSTFITNYYQIFLTDFPT
jgi:hypothetical protein